MLIINTSIQIIHVINNALIVGLIVIKNIKQTHQTYEFTDIMAQF